MSDRRQQRRTVTHAGETALTIPEKHTGKNDEDSSNQGETP
jgi:hypothetical protein